ncbi:MAG TPA: hypothetical protein VG246_00990 [Acidimicrobiales bacterium]|nr:hypothetical protein [Acidimicrobiales bacterium]
MASRTIHRYKRILITPATFREKLVFVPNPCAGAGDDAVVRRVTVGGREC